MAWVTSGSVITKEVMATGDKDRDFEQTKTFSISCDDTCCLAMILNSSHGNVNEYVINVYSKKTGSLQRKGNATLNQVTIDSSGPEYFTQTFSNFDKIGTAIAKIDELNIQKIMKERKVKRWKI